MLKIKPQEGFQEEFLSTSADIVIGGSGAGVGKTFALLIEPLRFVQSVKGFGGVIFRRTYPQITHEGALWDTSKDVYGHIPHTKSNESNLSWTFGNGNRIKFSHLQHEKDVYEYQGSQIPYMAFDELTHFTEKQFFYLLSRSRSVCGVKPYVRCTCNPDPESWVARLVEWWVDQVTGFHIAERAGVVRYFIKDGDKVVWGSTKQEVIDKCPHIFGSSEFKNIPPKQLIKSLTFIPGSIYDNKKLLEVNPAYLSSLMAQDESTKNALLHNNWKVKVDDTSMIQYVKMNDSFFATYVGAGQRYISADIATYGSDRFVIGFWIGMRLEDIEIHEKMPPNEIELKIKSFAHKYSVPRSNIIYDADGVGIFLRGYLSGAKPFNNGAAPILTQENKLKKENYKNLKTQCYYKLAALINGSKLYVSELVQNKRNNDKFVKQLILDESRCIKKLPKDNDGKLQIISKVQMKTILGRSPDIMDMMMMRVFFELKPPATGGYKAQTKFTRQYR